MKNGDYVKNIANVPYSKEPVVYGNLDKLDEIRKLYKIEVDYKRAVVVLGGPNQYKRLEKALTEYKNDPSAALIISGFGKDFEKKNEYVAKGKNLDSIITENESINTEENAINSIHKISYELPSVKKITIVSDYAHQPRSEMLFKKYAKIESDKPYDIDFSGIKTENKLHRIIYELGAFPLSFMPYSMHKKLTEKIRETRYKT
ncbi:MAG: YdcF family protein [Candidatus Parvarchaeota archaeon]|nr:YdcF family protein [Candidatus Parvarchaeota archaeon]